MGLVVGLLLWPGFAALAPAQSSLGQPAAPAAAPAAPAPATPSRPAAPSRPATAAPAAPRPAGAQSATARPGANQNAARPNRTRPQTQRRPATPAVVAPPTAAPAPTPEPPPPEPSIGSATGLALPRFVPLRSDRVNLRVGPDTRFPIEWRYERRDLPVQIIREHEQWRRIRDVDGTEGWVHQSNLTPNRRTFLVRGNPSGEVVMRRRAEAEAPPVARLRAGVIGRVRACEQGSEWCEVQAQDSRGFVLRSEIFGVMPGEKVE
jgi:SH3-like domain-containing protein